VNTTDILYYNKALMVAAELVNETLVRLLLQFGADVLCANEMDTTV
jgi:hypothetical protein